MYNKHLFCSFNREIGLTSIAEKIKTEFFYDKAKYNLQDHIC